MRHFITTAGVACLLLFSGQPVGAEGPPDPQGSIIIADGFAAPNTFDTSALPAVFHDWCNNGDATVECVPTVQLEVFDERKDRSLGFIYAWGQDFEASADGSTLRFREFIYYQLDRGDLYTISEAGGHPAGAFADPTLVIPKSGLPGAIVLLGGAEGRVVGGTGIYGSAGGGYSTRLKVEFFQGNPVYYDELYIRFRDVRVRN